MRPLGLGLVVITLCATSAMAVPVAGTLLADGPVVIPPGATLDLHPLAVLNTDARGISDFVIVASHVRAYHVEETIRQAPVFSWQVVLDSENRSHNFTGNVKIDLPSGKMGYVGLLPSETTTGWLTASSSAGLTSREQGMVAAGTYSDDEDRNFDTRYFRVSMREPHMLVQASGGLRVGGAFVVKVFGPDLRISADSGDATFSTGTREPHGLEEGRVSWVLLELSDDALLTSVSASPWVIAAQTTGAEWNGAARLRLLGGSIEGHGLQYLPTGKAEEVTGRLEAVVGPYLDGGRPVTRIQIWGDLWHTTMKTETAPAPAAHGPIFLPLWGLMVGAALVAGASFGIGVLVQRAPVVKQEILFTAEEAIDRAEEAAQVEDWAEAAKWFERALKLAPTSARVHADLAFCLREIGNAEGALRLLEMARELGEDGEIEFQGALTALALNRPLEEVEAWLERALRAAPHLVLTLEADEDFQPLRERPGYVAALERAWGRLDENL